MRYIKKPVTIEAVRYVGLTEMGDPQFDTGVDYPEWLMDACAKAEGSDGALWVAPGQAFIGEGEPPMALFVGTLEGHMIASPDDWIVRGIKGELYPVKPDIFEATYDPVSEAEPGTAEDSGARADSETAGDMLARLGMDGVLWADEFCEAFPEISTADALPWFANAIMAGYDRGRAQGWKEDAPHGHPRFQDHGEVMGR